MIKAFLFDLDGVITDTAEYHYLAWKKLASQQGWAFDRELNEQLRGVSRMDSLDIIIGHNQASIDGNQCQQLATLKNQYYQAMLEHITPSDYLPGARQLLDDLKSNGYKIGLGSASKNSRLVLDRLNAVSYFDIIGDGNSVEKSKPAPDIFLYGATRLNLAPHECIVVEDAESGIEAGIAGGFQTIGIGPRERVGKAHLRFDSMSEANFTVISNFFKL
jgi:beta-phosphoglucomutase